VSDVPYGTEAILANALERWPNPSPERDYQIAISAPEFTCLCPRSGYPDFATIHLTYIPDEWIVELKSFKLYINGYRDLAISHEAATNRILDELVALLAPRWMQIRADWNPRGNVHTIITARHRQTGWSPGPEFSP
jgi:7-cyano-7-deazaguanine reductase